MSNRDKIDNLRSLGDLVSDQPGWPGMDKFKGRILHSHSYKHQEGFEDATNLIVGIGNSAVDIAVELSRSSKQVYLSTRRGAWIMNRVGSRGKPIDMMSTRFFMNYLPMIFPLKVLEWLVVSQLQARFDHAKYGVMPQHW